MIQHRHFNIDFYHEINISANIIRNAIRVVLDYFGENPLSMKIYLREDRDAGAKI
jgi:hypothetical protein